VTTSPARNRDSIRRLAALEPDVVAFGHGPVLRDAAPVLVRFAAGVLK
jgi:glyoxylase-like metal-dependent hydrolase (beta-lactamase superfamily II)